MVKRIAVLFPDGSMNVYSGSKSEAAQLAEGRHERDTWNKGERDAAKFAQMGEIEVDLMSFKERR
jgi:hypothetical protein